MVRLAEFGAVVDEGATEIALLGRPLGEIGHDGAELRARIAGVAGEILVPLPPEGGAALLEISDDQIVLRGKAAIEADLGDAGLLDDRLDADRPHAVAVEEIGGDVE